MESKDNLNEGGTTKALRLSSPVWEEWRFLLLFYAKAAHPPN